MKKGVAIPYIVALVIGLIIIVFIVYWVYRSFTGKGVTCSECKSMFLEWCTRCAMANKGSTSWTTNVGGFPPCAGSGNCSFCTASSPNCANCQTDCKSVGVESIL